MNNMRLVFVIASVYKTHLNGELIKIVLNQLLMYLIYQSQHGTRRHLPFNKKLSIFLNCACFYSKHDRELSDISFISTNRTLLVFFSFDIYDCERNVLTQSNILFILPLFSFDISLINY